MTPPSATSLAPSDRVLELVADRALFGLDDADRAEITRLSPSAPFHALHELDLAAGALTVALLGADVLAPVPESVIRRASVAASAWDAARATAQRPIAPVASPSRVFADVAWFAAAACLALAVIAWSNRPSPPTPAQQFGQMLNRHNDLARNAPDLIRIPWTATEDPAAAAGVSGEVIWSDAKDEGYMHIKGLAANDPSVEQYQLWVFDGARDERYPVDGGVFDIPGGATGEIVIPITTTVAVTNATLFAVTVEKPGGAVVSSRERIPILAKVDPQ